MPRRQNCQISGAVIGPAGPPLLCAEKMTVCITMAAWRRGRPGRTVPAAAAPSTSSVKMSSIGRCAAATWGGCVTSSCRAKSLNSGRWIPGFGQHCPYRVSTAARRRGSGSR